VSTPSRFYHDTRYDVLAFQPPASPVVVTALMPNPDLPSEKLDAFELGYRIEPISGVSFDIATFYNRYRQIYGQTPGTPFFEAQQVPHLVVPLKWNSDAVGTAHGAEISANWRALDSWHLAASYSWIDLRVSGAEQLGVGSPAHQASVRSRVSVSPKLEINSAAYYVGSIDSLNSSLGSTHIPSYVRFDTGVLYRPWATLELGLWGQNLLDSRHREISSQSAGTVTQIPRTWLARITKRF
jgi:iron complex outermembrane receptor protein